MEVSLDPRAMRESLREPAQRRFQAEVVQDGRPQQLGHLPHIADGFVHQPQAVVQTRGIGRARSVERRQVGLYSGQRLAQFVVEFMREAACGTLLVLQHMPGHPA